MEAYINAVFHLPETQGWQGLTSPPDDATDEAWVAGLVTQADWLGSNMQYFPYEEPTHTVEEYWCQAKEKACEAVFRAGLVVKPRTAPMTLAEALRTEAVVVPTPLQSWAAEVSLPDGPCLALIEDLTGAGKTEAATLLASRLVANGRASGIYWAMPTMATANAMYARAAPLVEAIYGKAASAALLGSKRGLNELFRQAREAGTDRDPLTTIAGTDTVPAEIACAEWIARDGRLGFLAPMGAGTVDQALLAILPSRHFPVRLAGLGARVLIIDEAHAYDTYTGTLLEELLKAHARGGGSAIILSATLTSALHEKLIKAWRHGVGDKTPAPAPLALPCAAVVTNGRSVSESFAGKAGRGTRRDTPVAWLRSHEEAVRVLKEAEEKGGACLWIRNTVDDAREAVEALVEAGVHPTLFHSRLTAGDRARVEEALLSRFGPKGGPRQGVVVATQVAEQSLDLDFDVMVSDLAPYDSLIQRAGRLHRHDTDRPAGLGAPVLHVLSPSADRDAEEGWYEHAFPRAAYVYEAHGRLWRAARRLEMDGGLPLASKPPRDLLDWVYGQSEGTPPALLERDTCIEGKHRAERQQGRLAPVALEYGYVGDGFPGEERAVTRLGDPTVPVWLARVEGGRVLPWERQENCWRAWALSEVGVPERKVGDGIVPEEFADEVAAVTKDRPWQRVWVLNEEGEGKIRCDKRVVAVRYSRDYGLELGSWHTSG